jgi:hypothetical protein
MGRHSLVLLACLLGSAGTCFAAEDEKNKQIDALTSIQLGDHSLKFQGENLRKSTDLDDPPALKNYTKEVLDPFVGFKFSTPLQVERAPLNSH